MKRTNLVKSVTLMLMLAGSARAAIVLQDVSQSSTTNNDAGWNRTDIWDPNQTPSAANDYVNPDGYVVRTPVTGTSTNFGGNSLTIEGTLALKSSDVSRTHTVNDLRLNEGIISNFTDNGSGGAKTQTLAGNMSILGNSEMVSSTTTQSRHITVSARVTGTGVRMVHSSGSAGTTFTYSNASNSFDGTWAVSSGILRFTSAAAVGAGDIEISGGTLEVQGDWIGDSLTSTGGVIALASYDWVLDSLLVNTTSVAPGTYSVSQLNQIATGRFSGTDGTIQIIPEPAAAALVAVGLMSLSLQRGRRS